MNLEDIIKNFRVSEDLSMQEFANKCGLSKAYISMLEKGKHPQNNRPLVPSLNTLNALASGMGISIDTLLSMMNSETVVSVNDVPAQVLELNEEEIQLVMDYRDASAEIREEAAGMLHRSAVRKKEGPGVSAG